MDEGVDVDAGPRAAGVEHHGVEDAAVVGRAAESGEEAPEGAGQMREGGPDPGSARPGDGEQRQERKRHGELHLHSEGVQPTTKTDITRLLVGAL